MHTIANTRGLSQDSNGAEAAVCNILFERVHLSTDILGAGRRVLATRDPELQVPVVELGVCLISPPVETGIPVGDLQAIGQAVLEGVLGRLPEGNAGYDPGTVHLGRDGGQGQGGGQASAEHKAPSRFGECHAEDSEDGYLDNRLAEWNPFVCHVGACHPPIYTCWTCAAKQRIRIDLGRRRKCRDRLERFVPGVLLTSRRIRLWRPFSCLFNVAEAAGLQPKESGVGFSLVELSD